MSACQTQSSHLKSLIGFKRKLSSEAAVHSTLTPKRYFSFALNGVYQKMGKPKVIGQV